MAKPNYQFEKRQKDLARKKKNEEKRQRKLDKKNSHAEANPDAAVGDVPKNTVRGEHEY